jgi:nucleoside 2-deoxyribosyltransferase
MPPHQTYIESHLGGGAVMRHKLPAKRQIGIDIDPKVVANWKALPAIPCDIVCADATQYLNKLAVDQKTLIYADPPYLPCTRKRSRVYRFDYTDEDHEKMIECLLQKRCMVMISGYESDLYSSLLSSWTQVSFAEYVSTRMEVFDADRMKRIRVDAAEAEVTAHRPMQTPSARIYLAGPFFTTAQQWLVDEARSAFRELGFAVFSPIHDVGEGPPNEVAPADIFALEGSQLVFALVDGLDAGTIFEVGYARARDIPVVCLAESVESRSLTMLLGSGCEVFDDFATSIYAACWQLVHYV